MSLQHKNVFDNKIINTRSIINISKSKITNKNDKSKMRWKGTIVMLLVRLRGTQFDLMEKNCNPWKIITFFRIYSILEK